MLCHVKRDNKQLFILFTKKLETLEIQAEIDNMQVTNLYFEFF